MTIWSSTQNPHILRTMIAAMNGLGQDQVRAIAPEVGGGFGAKINIYGEDYVASAISKQLGVPVKWIEDRSEAFVATTHGRDIIGYIDVAARRDGKVLGLKMRLIADIGAYNMLLTAAIPTLTMLMANGTYDIPAIRTTLTEVFTNKTPTDAYRGAGRPEATYFLERAMDMLAHELKLDPGRGAAPELHPEGQVPVRDADGRRLRLRRLRGRARPRARARRLERAEGRARRRARRRPARRPRPRDVRRGLRPRAVVVAADRRLGALAGHRRARRPHHRDDRRLAARSGQRDHVRADAGRSVRRAARARHDSPRRHRDREAGHRHVRQPIAGGRRHGAASRRRQGQVEDGEVCRGDARGASRRSRLRERHDCRQGLAGIGQGVRRSGVLCVRARAAARKDSSPA